MTSVRSHVASIAILLVGLVGCASDSRPDPRNTVKDFFAAMQSSDTLFLKANVDLHSVWRTFDENQTPDSADLWTEPEQQMLRELSQGGLTHKRWLANQIVLGRANSNGDTAWVEVSFIDRLTRVQYYNKMRLDYRGDLWVITSFKTL